MPGLPVVIVVNPAGPRALIVVGDVLVGACSAELGDHLGGEEVHVVEIRHVQYLQVGPLHADLSVGAELVGDLRGRPNERRVAAQLVDLATDRGGTTRDLALVATAHTTKAAEYVSDSGDRPASASAVATRSNWVSATSSGANGMLNSVANAAASAGVRLAPAPPMMIGGCGDWTGLGRAGESATV